MKIGLLTADIGNSMPNVGDFFITEGIRKLFGAHDCTRVPLHQAPGEATFSRLSEQDLLVICGSNLIGIRGGVRCAFTIADFRRLSRPIVALGLGCQSDLGKPVLIDERGKELLKFWTRDFGAVFVRDELTRKAVAEILGEKAVELSGCPSLLLDFSFLPALTRDPFPVFCFGPYHYQPTQMSQAAFHRLSQSIHRSLPLNKKWVTLLQEPSDFKYGGLKYSDRLFYAPRSPEQHLELLAGASQVVSFRIHPCLVAAANKISCVVLCLDERTKALSELLAIPHVVIDKKTRISQLRDEIETKLAEPPDEICRRVEFFRKGWQPILERLEIKKGSATRVYPPEKKNLTVAAITDRCFFISLVGLIKNLERQHAGHTKIHILCLDEESRTFLTRLSTTANLFLYSLLDVWGERVGEFVNKSAAYRAYRSKPRLVKKILKEQKENVLFVDADLIFFRDPGELESEGAGLLFPHWNEDVGLTRRYGMFNAGLFFCGEGSEPFLDWWSARTEKACEDNSERGYFFEQGYLDLVPLYFPEMKIYRGKDQNVGHWAFQALGVHYSLEGELKDRAGKSLGSFHAVGSDPLGAFEKKATWDQLCALKYNLPEVGGGPHAELRAYQQAIYSARIRRVMFVYHWFRFRLGIPLKLYPVWVDFGVCPPLREALAVLAFTYSKLRDAYRRVKRLPPYHPTRWLEAFRRDEVPTPV